MPLTYRNTNIEIELGDHVILRGVLWGKRSGVVCYVPGACKPHPNFERDGLSYWGISVEGGTVVSWPYVPGTLSASRRVVFEKRGDPTAAAIDPSEELL